jgi:hypothetical protein
MSKRPFILPTKRRPEGHTLHSKVRRAQVDVLERRVSLPDVLFLRLTGRELAAALPATRKFMTIEDAEASS